MYLETERKKNCTIYILKVVEFIYFIFLAISNFMRTNVGKIASVITLSYLKTFVWCVAVVLYL